MIILQQLNPSLALTNVERFQGPSLVYCIISSVSATTLSQEAGDDDVSLVEAQPSRGHTEVPCPTRAWWVGVCTMRWGQLA